MNGHEQINGWFSVFGASAGLMQNIFTAIMGIVMVGSLIYMIFQVIKLVPAWSSEDPEVRKQAKIRFLWIIIGTGIVLISTLIPTILWNTIGKYSIVNETIH